MKNLKFYIFNTIIIFFLSFLSHFIYEILPNVLTSIFFPVNESIWEHIKLFFTPFMIDILILRLFFQKSNIVYHNFLLSGIVSAIFSCILYLIIYLPIYFLNKDSLFLDISLLIVVIFISQLVLLYILKKDEIKCNNFVLILIISIYIMFGYFTYNPLHNFLFLDKKENKYGINTYILGN